jgi:hypothetical protein
MTARVAEGEWNPLPGSLPDTVNADTIYVIPTRAPAQGSDMPRYTDTVRYLPKAARSKGLPVEFATPSGTREYLAEYSIDPETWSLGLACLQMASDWLILAVTLFIDYRADAQGWKSEEAKKLPLKVTVAETSTGRNYEIDGSGAEVVEALKVLQQKRGGKNG